MGFQRRRGQAFVGSVLGERRWGIGCGEGGRLPFFQSGSRCHCSIASRFVES